MYHPEAATTLENAKDTILYNEGILFFLFHKKEKQGIQFLTWIENESRPIFLGFTPPTFCQPTRGEQAACVPRTFFWEQCENVSNLDTEYLDENLPVPQL